ncbi:MAG: hypothetical protein KQH57_11600 [Actinomycetales bacterium]|nr:hypothetical protein [Actinomycetales bacterium]
MTTQPTPRPDARPRAMLAAFPRPGRAIERAYAELDIAAYGTGEQKNALGDQRLLARPWDPATCTDPTLRAQLWQWLDGAVNWLNREYMWDAETMVPACWPRHPHLVQELAVLADLRRRAGLALTGDALEEWHRYALPAFVDRMRHRVGQHCANGHQPWPGQGRHARHLADGAATDRAAVFAADLAALPAEDEVPTPPAGRRGSPESRPRLQLIDGMKVDPETGEIVD